MFENREEEMPAQLSSWRLVLLAPILALVAPAPSAAAELNPAALIYQRPDQIKWNPPSAAGSQNAVLVGDPSKPGFYVVRNKWLKGNHFSKPHFHPNDRFITVLDGTWWMGSGPTFDPDNSVPMPAGTFVTHFGKQVHWDGAKAEDASLLIVGDGPGTSTQVEPATGKFTQLDPTAVVYTAPEQYKWRDPTGAAGTNQVVLHGDPTKSGLYVVLNRFSPAISASRTSTPTTASSPSSRAPGGSRPATRSTRTTWNPCPPAASSPISASRCTGMGRRTRRPGCSSSARGRER
jgi:hypothetical protein